MIKKVQPNWSLFTVSVCKELDGQDDGSSSLIRQIKEVSRGGSAKSSVKLDLATVEKSMKSGTQLILKRTSKFSILGLQEEYNYDQLSLSRPIHIFLDIDDEYTRVRIQEAFDHPSRRSLFRITLGPGEGMDAVALPTDCDFQWAEYERIDWSAVLDGKHAASSYCIRKGLSRKAQLALYTQRYSRKNLNSILTRAIPQTTIIDTWPVWEDGARTANLEGLGDILTTFNSEKSPNLKERLLQCLAEARKFMDPAKDDYEDEQVWILKGSTTNKGAGISIIHIFEQLVDICWSESDVREWYVPIGGEKRPHHSISMR